MGGRVGVKRLPQHGPLQLLQRLQLGLVDLLQPPRFSGQRLQPPADGALFGERWNIYFMFFYFFNFRF